MSILISSEVLLNWYQQAKKKLIIEDISLFELEYLLTELTELTSLDLRLNSSSQKIHINSKISLTELQNLWYLRVKKRCPIQYLIGECHWRNFTLKVTPDVLIPRPETELIIDLALQLTLKYPPLQLANWLDLGTGSGAIAIGLADVLPLATIYAVDKSEKALKIAQENSLNLGYKSRIKFYHGSWFNPINELKNSLSVIISNPPYIPSKMVLELQPEVVNYEPKIALDGGEDGLNEIRYLIKNAPNFLITNGFLLLEIMAEQDDIVKDLLTKNGSYTNINTYKDLEGIDRFVMAQCH
ncbi:MAG: peptide chain release factor N(5)-glutamine methyltransferase [Cyanobacteria bacterium]|nr:peptide chain release factor N(5)-glutamine methyltransferase [Cyanobacteria bacterium CG_2015-16_32_12]NCO77645.1 peptide chain release factor N(5)-glutamine methyltransferase [Cyanobacteria bacterium CG_2015-22_32_23]NCQ04299.1 peptide chain release factor N(5)-glutamine methyltransferase [Cyanobacteria bacterium CG_2015-09_32_10]NCQ42944.1 peptide chain release factor N(5)-glutamine methyltransferase [Cyanobacteria bacterium CG_2015-04_32_10]